MYIVIGNIIALVAALLMVYSGYVKDKKKVLVVQSIEVAISSISNLILGGITGFIVNVSNLVRNILCYNDKLNKIWTFIFLLIVIFISLYFNNLGIIGLFPLISSIIYTLFINTKDIIKFKIINIIAFMLWLIYDLLLKNYVMAIFDISSIITNIISIIQIKTSD